MKGLRIPIFWRNVRGRSDMRIGGSQVPSNSPGGSPEGDIPGLLGGALEFIIHHGFGPEGPKAVSDTGLQGSCPHGGTCLPFCRGIWVILTPFGSFLGTFPQGLFFNGPEGQYPIRCWGWEQRSNPLHADQKYKNRGSNTPDRAVSNP